MGLKDKAEACGRCAMTSVTGMNEEGSDSDGHGPFDGARIEVPEDEMRRVSPHVIALGKVKDRLDGLAAKFTYDR